MSGWQLTRHGTLAHDSGGTGESSRDESLGEIGEAGIFRWVVTCGRVGGWVGGWSVFGTQSFSSGQLAAAL